MSASSQPPQLDPNNLPKGVYLWPIDKAQADRLSKMLDTDFYALKIKGTYVHGPQIQCDECGKLSGLDDFVNGALKFGIHDQAFMVKTLKEGSDNRTPPHKLHCCVCGTTFVEANSVTDPSATYWTSTGGEDAVRRWTRPRWTSEGEIDQGEDAVQPAALRRWSRPNWTHEGEIDASEDSVEESAV